MSGESISLILKENSFSDALTATVKIGKDGIKAEGQFLPLGEDDGVEVITDMAISERRRQSS
jgi:hypothetical protein